MLPSTRTGGLSWLSAPPLTPPAGTAEKQAVGKASGNRTLDVPLLIAVKRPHCRIRPPVPGRMA